MGKKRIRKTYTSKGQRPSVSGDILKSCARDVHPLDRALDKLKAWRLGKNPWVTIKNPERHTNRDYIKVRANSYYGNPKTATYNIYHKGS